jgi:hypothetical protein
MHFAEPLMRPHFIGRHQGTVPGHDFRFHDHIPSQGMPVLIWPYDPYDETSPPTTETAGTQQPDEPQIIVIRNNPPRQGVTSQEAKLDFSYVGGCHQIPNGYHCDPSDVPKQP